MDAMYGTPTEAIEELVGKAKSSAETFRWEDYADKVADDSVQMSDGTYMQLLKALEAGQRDELGLRIAIDWVTRQRLSISAFEAKVALLRKLGREAEAKQEEAERLVEVEFIVTTQDKLTPDAKLILVGNTLSLGSWKNPGLELHRNSDTEWRAQANIPRGELQFKVAIGGVERVETRADGRSISNRRFRVQSACDIRANVEAFKEAK